MQVAGGLAEDGVIIGNTFDKYGSSNPIVRRIMEGFDQSLSQLVATANPRSIHEVGCGEGYWVVKWCNEGIDARGSDFSEKVIAMAQSHASASAIDNNRFFVRSIYELEADRDAADLIVCCEVLEHLEEPEKALEALARATKKDLIISVPREPLWCALNMARGKYWSSFGNTPGHLQNWSKSGIVKLASRYFDIERVLSPLPWTMIHCKPKSN